MITYVAMVLSEELKMIPANLFATPFAQTPVPVGVQPTRAPLMRDAHPDARHPVTLRIPV